MAETLGMTDVTPGQTEGAGVKVWRRASKGGGFYCCVPVRDTRGEIVRDDGRARVRTVSLRTRDAREAVRRAAALERGEDPFEDLRVRAAPVVIAPAPDLERVHDRYIDECEGGSSIRRALRLKTLKTYRPTMRAFFAFLRLRGRRTLAEVEDADVRAFLDAKLAEGDRPNTYNGRRQMLSTFFAWATRAELWTRANPVRRTIAKSALHDDDYVPERVRYYSPAEVKAILEELARRAGPEWRLVEISAWIARYTGSRIGEIPTFRYEHFIWDSGILDAPTSKTKRRKIVELHPELVSRFRDEWRGRVGLVIVPLPSWRQMGRSAEATGMAIGQLFVRMLREIGIRTSEPGAPGDHEGLGMHALRHTFASEAILAGVPIDVVAQWLGHSTPEITYRHYSHLIPRSQRTQTVRWWDRVATENPRERGVHAG